MIEITALHRYFHKGQTNEVHALRGISLSVPKSTYVVIVGANGSGKSTLLNIIAGDLFPQSGDIFIQGTKANRLPDYKRSKWISRVFQNPLTGTAPNLSVLDNFRLAALRGSTKKMHIGITETFKKQIREQIATLEMGLENKLDQPMGTLSGGQRQALTLLMSVLDRTELLLLDEPSAALDPKSARIVMETADKLIKTHGLTAILITHDLKDACLYGNRIIQMAEGQIIRDLDHAAKAGLQPSEVFEWF